MKRIPLLLLIFILSVSCFSRQLRPLVWVLDAGHGGKDQGTCLKNVLEKDLTLNLTNRVAELIRKNKPGIKLILTRTDDTFVSLDERCQIANRIRADLFLSIHINFAQNNRLLSGTETFHANKKGAKSIVQASHLERNADKSELLAWLLQKSYYESGRPADRGARASNLYVLLNTEMPAALTEVGFLSNVSDAAYLQSERGQKQIALDIYNALNEYYTTTQANTHLRTLRTLRQSLGTNSGLKVDRLRNEVSSTDNVSSDDSWLTAQALSPDQLSSSVTDPANGITVDDTTATSCSSSAQVDPPGSEAAIRKMFAQKEPPGSEAAIKRLFAQRRALGSAADTTKQVVSVNPANPVADSTKQVAPVNPVADSTKPVVPVNPVADSVSDTKKQVAQAARPDSVPIFSVQLFSVTKEIKAGDSRLKGLAPVKILHKGNVYKVLYGGSKDYLEARRSLEKTKELFPDAFIVAYIGDRAISTAEALQMIR
ncbi:MAG: N-acetylmuramoyl-L-alanine amidase [Bacteroidaceae bacterium]|nr:N-acetylmuramoyl-L-alanine amidase [Paraprevotella sp.]MDY2716036.1 N-acetylmuramoyl-L-alanine amidase [Bacteroidaceae bacterium]